jgi:hypothetical protein
MSAVHILAIPKKRIYNAVSLDVSHIAMLKKIQRKAKEVLSTKAVKDFYFRWAINRGSTVDPPVKDFYFR